ncbi:hypothetical protein ACOSP7_032147 [Xanthoceras sorbifolium]
MEGQRPLVSPPVKNWGLTITSQYAFLACLSSFMVRYSGVLGVEEPHQSIPNLVVKLYCGDDTVGEGTSGNRSSGDGAGPVVQRIRARGYEPRCWRFESLLAHNRPKREGPFPWGRKIMIGIADPKLWNLGVGLLSKWSSLTFSFFFIYHYFFFIYH